MSKKTIKVEVRRPLGAPNRAAVVYGDVVVDHDPVEYETIVMEIPMPPDFVKVDPSSLSGAAPEAAEEKSEATDDSET
jgi:hypothetical protein